MYRDRAVLRLEKALEDTFQSTCCFRLVHESIYENDILMASFNTQAFQTQGDGFMGLGAGPGGLSFQDFGTQDASSYMQSYSQMVGEES